MMDESGYEPRYLEGLGAWSRCDYFLAHEIWEALWRDTRGPNRLFYHSLIQAAVALYHKERNHPEAAERLYHRGLRKALPYFPQHQGLNLVALWDAVEQIVCHAKIENQRIAVHPSAIVMPELLDRLIADQFIPSQTGDQDS